MRDITGLVTEFIEENRKNINAGNNCWHDYLQAVYVHYHSIYSNGSIQQKPALPENPDGK